MSIATTKRSSNRFLKLRNWCVIWASDDHFIKIEDTEAYVSSDGHDSMEGEVKRGNSWRYNPVNAER
jgi:hypothetical protein